MGHAVLEHEAKKRGLPVEVDSAYSVPIDHRARAVESADFKKFDYILASDGANLSNLKSMAPKDSTATIMLFGSFDDGKPIADPYYGGINGFEKAYDQCVRYSNGFLDQVFGKKESVL
ncbi:Low molecular weight phosphotyrosine protein phosphatase [Ceratobasidium theobromae]|uniref:Low molecular weight phosphotyrosine protein phosphatase n=1 Tax=Ceratobasidium theobromae TaxID=1582974 RepID=A0A5N5QS67_9AGAM|nr:Low molecular weight phosphotyrosine protein phosphatase [Ceratobasidium theobromae]